MCQRLGETKTRKRKRKRKEEEEVNFVAHKTVSEVYLGYVFSDRDLNLADAKQVHRDEG